MRILPREQKFFALFLNQVDVIAEASRLLLEGARAGNTRLAQAAREIMDLEHKGDEIIHELFTRLNQTFITPLDPEDIHQLSARLDDVLDGIEDAAFRLAAYKLEPIPDTVVLMSEIICSCGKALHNAFDALEKNQKLMEHLIEINRLENEGDRLVRAAIADLFDHEKDPILIIKLKEVYEFLEATIDTCEDVANVLQNIVVKNV